MPIPTRWISSALSIAIIALGWQGGQARIPIKLPSRNQVAGTLHNRSVSEGKQSPEREVSGHRFKLKTAASDIRLVGGSNIYEGRVEVLYNGKWGTVCSNGWGDKDGRVACRQLGFGNARNTWRNAYYGEGTGPIWMDYVKCRGFEERLDHCRRSGGRSNWGIHDCDHSEDASLQCWSPDDSDPCDSSPCQNGGVCVSQEDNFVCNCPNGLGGDLCELDSEGRQFPDHRFKLKTAASDIRLARGSNVYEGRVEILYDGVWGTVCDNGWGDKDGRVACRQLGFDSVRNTWRKAHYGQGTGPIWLDNLKCKGFEERLDHCKRSGGQSNWGVRNCDHSKDASLRCWPPEDPDPCDLLPCQNGGLCLSQEDNFVCTCPNGWGGDLCDRRECTIGSCLNGGICVERWGVHLCNCRPGFEGDNCGQERSQNVRLVGGTAFAGRVEVFLNGEWGTVCDDLWDLEDATVVCNEFGYPGGAVASYGSAFFGQGYVPILLDDVQCEGTESRLEDCIHRGLGRHNCAHYEDAGVMCRNPNLEIKPDLLNTSSCGTRPVRNRIVDGVDAGVGEWPWSGYLRDIDGWFTCGAALISNQWAITAAHCKDSLHSIVLGDIAMSSFSVTHQESTVTVFCHPNYDFFTVDNDICLLKLGEPVTYTNYVRPVCFGVSNQELATYPAGSCYVIGWGALYYEGYVADHLQELATNLIPTATCNEPYGYLTGNMICSSTGTTSGSCQGDSGGPLMCDNGYGEWHLVGITSHGYECARIGYPDVLARVSRYSQWIAQTIALHQP